MRPKIIAGNWKMNGSVASIQLLLQAILENFPKVSDLTTIVFPPAIYLPLVRDLLKSSSLSWGSQNVYKNDFGAFTGELSCPMLKDFGCRYVLVGHSERRQFFGEDENLVREKFHKIKEHDMIPILCIGETLTEREQGLTMQILEQQLRGLLEDDPRCFENAIIAYEPVWAIGTGLTALPNDVQITHQAIREMLATFNESLAEKTPILYGGSLNEKNASDLLVMPDVDGGLIGGASLDAQKFVEIIECIN